MRISQVLFGNTDMSFRLKRRTGAEEMELCIMKQTRPRSSLILVDHCPPLGKKKKKKPVLGDFVAPRIQGDLRSGQRLFSEISALKVDEIRSSVHQTRQRCQGLILGFVALWVQVRNLCYSAKVSKNLLWPQLYRDIWGGAREAVPLQPLSQPWEYGSPRLPI